MHRNVQFVEEAIIKDRNGWYIIIQGELFNMSVVLANMYTPNWNNVQFFSDLFSLLPNLGMHNLILGGDCILHPTLDCSSPTATTINKSAQRINSFLQAYGVYDPWRFKYLSSKQFSFYSLVHQTYSRIDYFPLDSKLLPLITQVEYDSIVISDHRPVLLRLRFPENSLPQATWHFTPRLLADEDFIKYIEAQINLLLEINESPEISYITLWETLM